MTETFDRLMRETFGRPRRLTLDERNDLQTARGCAVCGRTDVTLWQPEHGGPCYCPEDAPNDEETDR